MRIAFESMNKIELAAPLPNRARLARLITQRSIGSLDLNGAKPEFSQP
jgi:hypothetical protein